MLGINKFGANGDIVVSLQHAAGENGVDAKFTGNRRWINGLAFVTVRGRQRNDLQVGKLRERADEILGDSFPQKTKAYPVPCREDARALHSAVFCSMDR